MTKEQIGKLPPQNMELESSVLGALLLDQEAISKVIEIIKPDDFYKEAHKIIFEATLELFEDRQPCDILTLSNKLQEKGQLDKIGGASYLTNLVNSVPTASNVAHYATIISEKATLRGLIAAASQIADLGFNETKDISLILDESEQTIFKISQKFLKRNFIPIKSVLADSFERIDKLHKNKGQLRGTPTGFKDLDYILAGLQKSDLIIVAGRPGMGKTSLALNIAQNVAQGKNAESSTAVGIFSLEMSKEQLVDRLICVEADIDSAKLRKGKLDDDDFPKIGRAMGVLSEIPLYIDDSPSSNVMEIRAKARRLQSEHNLGLVVIDYLQLMESKYKNEVNRVQEVSEMSRSLKGLARELNIPVICLSQLSRAVENRPGRMPELADLRESGSIEQDADVVMFIYRESYYNREIADVEKKKIAKILIKKHRNGPTGEIDVLFIEEKTKFADLEKQREEEITLQE